MNIDKVPHANKLISQKNALTHVYKVLNNEKKNFLQIKIEGKDPKETRFGTIYITKSEEILKAARLEIADEIKRIENELKSIGVTYG